MTRPKAKLENWYVVRDQLVGNVFGHPRFDDGTAIRTSPVARWDHAANKAYTVNTDYELGEPAVDLVDTTKEISKSKGA